MITKSLDRNIGKRNKKGRIKHSLQSNTMLRYLNKKGNLIANQLEDLADVSNGVIIDQSSSGEVIKPDLNDVDSTVCDSELGPTEVEKEKP